MSKGGAGGGSSPSSSRCQSREPSRGLTPQPSPYGGVRWGNTNSPWSWSKSNSKMKSIAPTDSPALYTPTSSRGRWGKGDMDTCLILKGGPSHDEAQMNRIVAFWGTCQCLVMSNFAFTVLCILLNEDRSILLVVLWPFGLVGMAGWRQLHTIYLVTYLMYLFVEAAVRAYLTYCYAYGVAGWATGGKVSSLVTVGEEDAIEQKRTGNFDSATEQDEFFYFWALIYSMLNLYIALNVWRLCLYIWEMTPHQLSQITSGEKQRRIDNPTRYKPKHKGKK